MLSRARACDGRLAMFLPRYSIRPPAGGTPPPMALSSVVLPAPFGPTIVTNSPSPTSRETSASAWSPPYETLRLSTLNTAEPALAQVGLDDGGIAHHVVRPPLRDQASVVE